MPTYMQLFVDFVSLLFAFFAGSNDTDLVPPGGSCLDPTGAPWCSP